MNDITQLTTVEISGTNSGGKTRYAIVEKQKAKQNGGMTSINDCSNAICLAKLEDETYEAKYIFHYLSPFTYMEKKYV